MITRWLFGKDKEATGTLVGLDAAGKTTMLYQMKLGKFICTIPSIGFFAETISEKGWNITLMDLGGKCPPFGTRCSLHVNR
jgi:ADP-ribosylation factor 1/2